MYCTYFYMLCKKIFISLHYFIMLFNFLNGLDIRLCVRISLRNQISQFLWNNCSNQPLYEIWLQPGGKFWIPTAMFFFKWTCIDHNSLQCISTSYLLINNMPCYTYQCIVSLMECSQNPEKLPLLLLQQKVCPKF